jgi:hypothetical protein
VPVAKDWLERLPATARAFIDKGKVTLDCESQLRLIQSSFAERSLQFLSTPIEAMFSVRGEHSAVQVNRVVSSVSALRNTYVGEARIQSLANQLSNMSAGAGIPMPFSDQSWILDEANVNQMYTNQKKMLEKNAEFAGVIAADGHYKNLDLWHARALRAAAELTCSKDLPISMPPLGWTLNAKDKALLDCMSARAAIMSGFPSLDSITSASGTSVIPDPKWLTSDPEPEPALR